MRNSHALLALFVAAGAAAALVLWLAEDDASSGLALSSPEAGVEQGVGPIGPSGPGALAAPEVAVESESRQLESRELVASGEAALPEAPALEGEPVARGLVTDEWGAPLEGASVTLYVVPKNAEELRRMPGLMAAARRSTKSSDTMTDEDGRFELELPASDRRLDLEVRLEGYLVRQRELGRPVALPVEVQDLSLVRGCIIRGMVVEPGGGPIRGARIDVEHEQEEPQEGFNLAELGLGFSAGPRTKADGRFELLHAPAGPFEVQVTHKKRPGRRVTGEARVGDEVELTIELPVGGRIAGRVLGLPDDVSGVVVQARRAPDTEALPEDAAQREEGMIGAVFSEMGMSTADHSAKLDAEGRFELEGLETSGAYLVWAAAPNRQMFLREAVSEERKALVGEDDLVLDYRDGVRVKLQVVDAKTNAPVTDFTISSKVGDSRRLPSRREDVSDRDGEALLTRIRPKQDGATVYYAVRAVGYQTVHNQINVPQSGEIDGGRVFLQPAPVVRLRVTRAVDDAPVVGAAVVLAHPEDIPPLWATKNPMMMGNMSREQLGEPEAEDQQPRRGETDEDGLVLFTGFPGVTAVLTIEADDAALHREKLALPQVGDVDHEVVLTQGGSVLVQVVDAGGFAAGKSRIEYIPVEANPMDQRAKPTDETGALLLEALQPGEYRFRATEVRGMGGPPGGRRGRDGADEDVRRPWFPATVREGEVTELTLSMPEVGVLVGTVLELSEPLAGAALSIFEDSDEAEGVRVDVVVEGLESFTSVAMSTTDEHGAFRVEQLPVGAYRMRVRHKDRAMPATVRFDVSEGENELTVQLEVTSVSGTIRDHEGKVLGGVSVRPIRKDRAGRSRLRLGEAFGMSTPGESSATSDAEGRYSLRGIETGTEMVIRATAPGWCRVDTEPFTLAPGEARERLNIRMERAGRLEVTVIGGRPFQRVSLEKLESDPDSSAELDPAESASPGSNQRLELTRKGVASFEDLEPGQWRVSAGEAVQEVEVSAGEVRALELDLSAEEGD